MNVFQPLDQNKKMMQNRKNAMAEDPITRFRTKRRGVVFLVPISCKTSWDVLRSGWRNQLNNLTRAVELPYLICTWKELWKKKNGDRIGLLRIGRGRIITRPMHLISFEKTWNSVLDVKFTQPMIYYCLYEKTSGSFDQFWHQHQTGKPHGKKNTHLRAQEGQILKVGPSATPQRPRTSTWRNQTWPRKTQVNGIGRVRSATPPSLPDADFAQ